MYQCQDDYESIYSCNMFTHDRLDNRRQNRISQNRICVFIFILYMHRRDLDYVV